MPDISMCFGTNCVIKDQCFRCTANPSTMQSYFAEPPFNKGALPFKCKHSEYCDYYWPNREEKYNEHDAQGF